MEIRTVHDAHRFSAEKMQKVNLFATEKLFCDVYCLEPGQSQEAHQHDSTDKVYVVLEGRGRFRVGQESEELGPGQAVLAPAGELHGVDNTTPDRLILLVLIAPPPLS